MRTAIEDLKYAVRSYRRAPFQSAVAVVMIAVSTAFAVAFFSLYGNLALLSPRGFEAPSELVGIALADADSLDVRLSGRLRRAIAESSSTIDTVAAVMYIDVELGFDGNAMPATVAVVTEEFFEGLGVAMHLGSGLPQRPGAAEPIAVIGHGLWRSRFGGDADVLGRHVEIEGSRFAIVGVTHPAFEGAHRGPGAVVWLPLAGFATAVWNVSPDVIADRLRIVTAARLASGRSPSEAEAELRVLSDVLRTRFPDDMLGLTLTALPNLAPDPRGHEYAVRQVQLLFAAATLLAVVGAGNLSLFFLARVPRRRREMAIRRSLGATDKRLVRQLLTESSLLVNVGVGLGLLGSLWLAMVLRELAFLDGVQWEPATSWGPMVAFTAVLALLLAAAVGSAPALDLTRGSLAQGTRNTPGRLATSQRGIICAQISIATIVLAVAALFGDALARTALLDSGFDAREVTVVRLARVTGDYPDDAAAVLEFRRRARERLMTLGGVDSVGFGGVVPGVLAPDTYSVTPQGGFRDEIASAVARLGADWMDALGVRVLRGRLPAPEDRDAVVVSRRFAEAVWGTLDALGARLVVPTEFGAAGGAGAASSLAVVTAVVEDIRFANPADLPRPTVFINQPVGYDISDFVLLKGSIGAREAEAAMSEVLDETTPRLQVVDAFSLEQSLAALLAPDRSRTKLTAMAGALTALLAALGFFGALGFMVDSGRFELALRAALGADPRRLRNHVIGRGLWLGLPGVVAGLVLAAVVLDRVREAFELQHAGVPTALGSCAAVLLMLMCLAIGLPAVRASRLEPRAVLNEH